MSEKKPLNRDLPDKEKPQKYQKPQLIKYPKVKRIFGVSGSGGVDISA